MQEVHRNIFRVISRVLILSFSLFIVSCGSGTSVSVETPEKELVRRGFSPSVDSCSSPPPESVYMCFNESESSQDVIAVDILINSSVPVYGAAFDVVYDPSMVELQKKANNTVDFLILKEKLWKRLYAVAPENQAGTLIIGSSLGQASSTISGGITPLLTLKFNIPTGRTPLSFKNNSVFDSNGQSIGINPENWYSGELSP